MPLFWLCVFPSAFTKPEFNGRLDEAPHINGRGAGLGTVYGVRYKRMFVLMR